MNEIEIENLCTTVINNVKGLSSTVNDSSLLTLRRLCGQQTQCECERLPPHKRLSLLLQACVGEVVTDYNVGLSVISNYSYLSHCQTVLEQLLSHALHDTPSHSRQLFIDRLWHSTALINLPAALLEELLVSEKRRLEEEILGGEYERLVLWSVSSARIFCLVTSVLNTLVRRTVSQCEHSVSLVQHFVARVKTQCVETKVDFVLLYPSELHGLVSLLDIPPESYPVLPEHATSVTVSTVTGLVDQLLHTKPVQAVCLLTHFPSWAVLLARNKTAQLTLPT